MGPGKLPTVFYRAVSYDREASVIAHLFFVFFLSFLFPSGFLLILFLSFLHSYLDLGFALFRLLSLVFPRSLVLTPWI